VDVADQSHEEQRKREFETISSAFLDHVRTMRPEAWARLVDVYGAVVYRWCRQSGLSEHDSADIVQDVFSAVARNVERFRRDRSTDSFRGANLGVLLANND